MTESFRPRSSREIEADVNREMARIQEEHPRDALEKAVNPRRRCRVCHDPEGLRRVNRMLSVGLKPDEIVENLADLNAAKRKNEKIGYWSVYHHRKEHFNTQETVNASWRRILERRAEEQGIDLAAGAGSLLTLRGYLEIIRDKGFAKLIDDNTDVGYTVGLDAARELEQLMKADKDQAERAELRRRVALIQQAIVETLSEDQMKAINHRLDILQGKIDEDVEDDTIEGEVVDDDDDEYDDDDVADFVMDADEDDPLED